MKNTKKELLPTLNQLQGEIEQWRRSNENRRNISIPEDLREKICGLKGHFLQREIAESIGLHPVTVSKIMRRGCKNHPMPADPKKKIPKVITLAPLQMSVAPINREQKLEMESPEGWKLKISGQLDLTSIIKVMMGGRA